MDDLEINQEGGSIKKSTIIKIVAEAIIVLSILGGILYGFLTKKLVLNEFFVAESTTVGIYIPEGMGRVDCEELFSQKIYFVYLNATAGKSSKDPAFRKNWRSSRYYGLARGACHRFYYDVSGKEQAKYFIKQLGEMESGDLIPALRLELTEEDRRINPVKSDVIKEISAFGKEVEKAYGVLPLIYCDKEVYDELISGELKDYPIWFSSVKRPVYLEYSGDWILWEYTEKKDVEGIANASNGVRMSMLNWRHSLSEIRYSKPEEPEDAQENTGKAQGSSEETGENSEEAQENVGN